MTNEKEFAAMSTEIQTILEAVANLGKQIESLKELQGDNHIQNQAMLSRILEVELTTQDQYDKLMEMIRKIGRDKGFKMD